MPDTPYTISQFGGLSLHVDPLEVGATGAVAMVNADLDVRGTVRCRNGLTAWSTYSQPSASSFYRLATSFNGGIIAGTGAITAALNVSGALITTSSSTPATSGGYANFGTPSGSATYIAVNGANPPMKFDGTSFSTPSYTGTTPTGAQFLASWQDRLVAWGLSSNPYRLLFSDRTDPTTFQVNNWVDVGSETASFPRAGTTWMDNLYIPGPRQWSVFYSVSLESDGSPVFNYRAIATPFGDALQSDIVNTPDGVYLLTSEGLFRIAGGTFELVSDAVNPLLQGLASPSLTIDSGTTGVYADGRIYFAITSVTAYDYLLIWDMKLRTWLLWNIPFFGMCVGQSSQRPRVYLACRRGSAPNPIVYVDPTATADDGTAITWSYKSGRYRLANPGAIATTRESAMWGTGTVTLAIDTDLYATSDVVTLGNTDIAEGWLQRDQEGHWFQHTLSGTGPATVGELTHYISFVRGTDEGN